MNVEDRKILQEHGERLARIETAVSNHLLHGFTDLKAVVGRLDARLWWIIGLLVTALLGIIVSLVR